MKRFLSALMLVFIFGGYWVVTTDGQKFDGPYRYSSDCNDAARRHAKVYKNISTWCRYLD